MKTDSDDPGQMDGRTIAARLIENRNDPDMLQFWVGVAVARIRMYQAALELAGIPLPTAPREVEG